MKLMNSDKFRCQDNNFLNDAKVTKVYLDTARMGTMLPRVQMAYCEFVRFAGEEGCSHNFDEFLRWGIESQPVQTQAKYSSLLDWHGLQAFKKSLGNIAGVSLPSTEATTVLLANRSFQLMKLSASLLFKKCKRVLTTDLEWPDYLSILKLEKERKGRSLKIAHIREAILKDSCTLNDVVSIIVSQYQKYGCDGLFISHVTFQGLRLPVEEVAKALSEAQVPPFIVVDGTQAFGHVPLYLELENCDFYIAGCHKWLRAYHLMGLGFCPRPSSYNFIKTICQQMMEEGELDDPLLRFTSQIESDSDCAFTETVNLGSLFSTAAAVANILHTGKPIQQYLKELVIQVEELKAIAVDADWFPLIPDSSFRCGIMLIQSNKPSVKTIPGKLLRAAFQSHGITLTAYGDGVVRVSAPIRQWHRDDFHTVRTALEVI